MRGAAPALNGLSECGVDHLLEHRGRRARHALARGHCEMARDRLRPERHVVLDQVDQDHVVDRIGLPPGAEGARPAERASDARAHPLVLLGVE